MAFLDRLKKPAPAPLTVALVAPASRPCPKCGISSWPAVREALGISQEQFAADMDCSISTVRRLEDGTHHCPHRLIMAQFRATVRRKAQYRERLRAANGVWPWPSDLEERTTR